MRLSRFTNKNNNKPPSRKKIRKKGKSSYLLCVVQFAIYQRHLSHQSGPWRSGTWWRVCRAHLRTSCVILSLTLFFFSFLDMTGSWLGNKKRMPWCYDEASRWRDYGGSSAVHSAATAAGRRRSLWHRRESSIFYFAEVRSGACLFTPKRSFTKDRPCKSIRVSCDEVISFLN